MAASSKTITSTGTMALSLAASKSGTSSTITFNFTSLPKGSIVTKVKIECPSSGMTSSGMGAIASTSINVKSSSMASYISNKFPVGSIVPSYTTGFIGKQASDTWYVTFSGTNADYMYSAAKSYKNVKMTIEYAE